MGQATGTGLQALSWLARSWETQITLDNPWASSTTNNVNDNMRPSSERGSKRQRRSAGRADMGRQQVATAAHGADQPWRFIRVT